MPVISDRQFGNMLRRRRRRMSGMNGLGQSDTSSLRASIAERERELQSLQNERMSIEDQVAIARGQPLPVRSAFAPRGEPETISPGVPSSLPGLPLGLTWGQLLIAGAGLTFVLLRGKK